MTRGDGKTTILRDIQSLNKRPKKIAKQLTAPWGESAKRSAPCACKRPSSLSRSVGARPGQWLARNCDVLKDGVRVESPLSHRLPFLLGAEEHEPEQAKDQHRAPGCDRQERKYGGARLGLACFGRGFDDLMVLPCGHCALASQMSRRRAARGIQSNACSQMMFRAWVFAMPRHEIAVGARQHPAFLATNRPRHG